MFADEVRIQLEGRRPPFGAKTQRIEEDEKYLEIPVGNSIDVNVGRGLLQSRFWLTRLSRWVPTATTGPERLTYLPLTNLTDQEVII